MCFDPLTMLAVAGTAMSVGGSLIGGAQAQAGHEAQARSYEQQARSDAIASAYEQRKERRQQDLATAAAIAATGASGVALKGSPTAVLAANAREGEMEIQAIGYSSQIRQNALTDQAAISRWSGGQARTASFINAGSSFVSGVSQLYDPNRAIRLGTNPFAPTNRFPSAPRAGGLY